MSKAYKFPTLQHAEADRLLAEYRLARGNLGILEAELQAQIEDLKREWEERLRPNREHLGVLDEQIRSLERQHQALFFGDAESCRVTLPHGVLLYDRGDYVVKKRGVTPERLESLGYPEAVKIAKSVDWDLLAAWPEEKLWAVGTERKIKETFGYEVGGDA